jgi:sialidase-1
MGILWASAFLLGAAAAAADANLLFAAYTGWPTCYRQPFLVSTPSALLVFVEGRPGIPWCSGTFWPSTVDFPILLRRSTDGGQTWGAVVNITRGDLDFLVAVYDAQIGRVLLLVQQGDTGTIQLSSDDDGLTWSAPVTAALVAPPGFASLIPGVGHGLQVSAKHCLDPSCLGTTGRLVVPFVGTRSGPVSNDTACGSCATALVISDDHGASWQLGAVSDQNGSREAALVQLDSASFATMSAVIFAGERNLGNATGFRLHAISNDGGLSFSTYGVDTTLPDVVTANWTGCVDGMTRVDSPGGASALVFTAPFAMAQRADLRMWRSVDGGATWGGPVAQLWTGPAAYSDALQLNGTHVGVVFEGGMEEFAEAIYFVAVPF